MVAVQLTLVIHMNPVIHMNAPIIRVYHMMFIHPYDTSHALFIHVDMLESGTAVQDAIPVNRQRERMRLIPTKPDA